MAILNITDIYGHKRPSIKDGTSYSIGATEPFIEPTITGIYYNNGTLTLSGINFGTVYDPLSYVASSLTGQGNWTPVYSGFTWNDTLIEVTYSVQLSPDVYDIKVHNYDGHEYTYSGLVITSAVNNNVYYAVEIFTETSETNTDIGLVSGVLRYITGTPNYSGSGAVWGSNEWNTGTVTSTWYEGFLIKDGLSECDRSIDISRGGNYGTLSSFQFELRNDIKLWQYFKSDNKALSLALLNKEIRFYTVLDNTFYQMWGGVITETPRNDTKFIVNCGDFPSKFHKDIPRYKTNEKVIPALLGDNNYVKAISIGENSIERLCFNSDSASIYKVYYETPSWGSSALWRYDIMTAALITGPAENAFNGKYMFVSNWSTDERTEEIDEDTGLYIIKSDASRWVYNELGVVNLTSVWCNTMFKTTPPITLPASFNTLHSYSGCFADAVDTIKHATFIKIVDVQADYALASDTVTLLDDKAYIFNEDKKQFEELGTTVTDQGSGIVSLNCTQISETESFTYYKRNDLTINSIKFTVGTITYNLTNEEIADVTDKDQTSYWIYSMVGSGTPVHDFIFEFDVTLPDTVSDDELFISPDIMFGPWFSDTPNVIVRYQAVDPYSRDITLDEIEFDLDGHGVFSPEGSAYAFPVWLLPADYYHGYGTRLSDVDGYSQTIAQDFDTYYGEYSTYSAASTDWYSNFGKIAGVTDQWMKRGISKRYKIRYWIALTSTAQIEYMILNEVGFFQKSTQDYRSDFYVRAQGETVSGVATDDVYNVFRKILEDYDQIDTNYINYGNLENYREDWLCNRQLLDQKNSKDYLKQLCEHSYVALFPDRLGKRHFNVWLNTNATPIEHNDSVIVRDSISDISYTPIRDIYNDFNINYNYNIASKEYDNNISITRTDQTTYPATGWEEYAHGITNYYTGEYLWGIARSGYLVTNSKQSPDTDICELPWYSNYDTVIKYLTGLLNWTTTQKCNLSYSLPLTSGNIGLELTDLITFTDVLATNNNPYYGFINRIKLNPGKNTIDIDVTLDPFYQYSIIIDAANSCTNPPSDRSTYDIYGGDGRDDDIIRPDISYLGY